MSKLGKLVWPLAVATALAGGCGDDDTTGEDGGETSVDGGDAALHDGGDAGKAGDASADAGDGGGGVLQSGRYAVSNLEEVTDGCGLELQATGDNAFTSTDLVNTGTALSIGMYYTPPTYTPAGYGEGSGPYLSETTATLTWTAHVAFTGDGDDGCEYDTTRTSLITFVADNTVTVDFTNMESNQNSKCKAAAGESTTTCTSHYSFTLTRESN